MSRAGGSPKSRRYSRLNRDGLSYPTLKPAHSGDQLTIRRICWAFPDWPSEPDAIMWMLPS